MHSSTIWFDYEIVLRDIYRLMLMVEYRSNINSSTLNDKSWLKDLHNKYFTNEAAHLLVSVAGSVRRMQDTEWRTLSADERSTIKGRTPVTDEERVGFHLMGSGNGILNFGLRDACNYIMHAHIIKWHAAGNGMLSLASDIPYDLVLESFTRADSKKILIAEEAVYLMDDTPGKNWEVVIELNTFLKVAAGKISIDMNPNT